MDSKSVCVIPARGGSKRIPGKNIREFCGKPIIEWSIETALQSGLFSDVVVSTDSEQIVSVAEAAGARVPFIRPLELSDDFTGTLPVIAHALSELAKQGIESEFACCLYPTSPFVSGEYLRQGIERLNADRELKFSFSVTSFGFPIFRAIELGAEARVSMFWPENESARSQDLPEAFHDAGQFYWGRWNAFSEETSLFSTHSAGVSLPRHLVQDIDTEEDWVRAEWMFRAAGLDQ